MLTIRKVWNICQSFANNSKINEKLSKTEIFEIVQSGRFLEKIICHLVKMHLGLAAARSAADEGIPKKIMDLDLVNVEPPVVVSEKNNY